VSRYRAIAGAAVGVLVAAAIVCAPAIGAPERNPRLQKQHVPAAAVTLDAFTPASADPKLAAMFAQSGLDTSTFAFTPSESQHGSKHAVSFAIRGQSNRNVATNQRLASDASAQQIGMAPIAYNLGVAVGWKRFALSGDLSQVDLAGTPGSRQTVDVGVSYSTRRFSGRVKALADRPLNDAPALTQEAPSYSVDVGGSYSLAHNLDLTAGVRYKTERDRLVPLDDDDSSRHDSQAVYIGTAFRF
jgi:hypothetical protein